MNLLKTNTKKVPLKLSDFDSNKFKLAT